MFLLLEYYQWYNFFIILLSINIFSIVLFSYFYLVVFIIFIFSGTYFSSIIFAIINQFIIDIFHCYNYSYRFDMSTAGTLQY